MIKKLLAYLFIFIACISNSEAQTPNHYLFEAKTATYTELVNDTIVEGAFSNASGLWMLDCLAGDNFPLFNVDRIIDNVTRHIVFSNNGFMRIEDDSTFIVLDAGLAYYDSIDANTKLSYVVEGTAGNKIVKVQWKNLKLRSGQPGNYVNYQIWLYQNTGVFEIYYGSSSPDNQSGFNTTNGPNVGMFYSSKSLAKMYEKIWINGSPSSPTIDSNRTVVFKAMRGIPVGGTLYRFVPKYVANNVATLTKNDVEIYPNPASSFINIGLHKDILAGSIVTMYDMQGKKVVDHKINERARNMQIPVANLSNGLYELHILFGNSVLSNTVEIQH